MTDPASNTFYRKSSEFLGIVRRAYPLPVDPHAVAKAHHLGRDLRLAVVAWLVDQGHVRYSGRMLVATQPPPGTSKAEWESPRFRKEMPT